jgi:cytochrome c
MSQIIILIMLIVSSVGANPVTAETDERMVAFNNYCRNCHSLKKNDQRLGPSLHSVFGARAGKVAGYRSYSGGLDDLVWDIQTLDRYLADPKSVSASTSMIYPPVRDPADRKRIIELLKFQAGR